MTKKSYPLILILMTFMLLSCGEKSPEKDNQAAAKSTTPQQTVQKPSASKKINPACSLTMGWDPWEPYQYLTPDNQVRGLEVDLISSMAKEAGCSVKFVQNDWMNLLKGIKSGSIDLLGGASKTAAREKYAIFSAPYRHESFVLYVNSNKLNEVSDKTLTELLENKFRLGVTEDYIYGDEVADMQDNPKFSGQIISVPITEVNYYNLIQGQIDGFLEDPFVAGYTIKRKGLSKQISSSKIEVNSGDVSIMFSKESVKPELVEAFNKGLESLKASGEYQKILDKYSH